MKFRDLNGEVCNLELYKKAAEIYWMNRKKVSTRDYFSLLNYFSVVQNAVG